MHQAFPLMNVLNGLQTIYTASNLFKILLPNYCLSHVSWNDKVIHFCGSSFRVNTARRGVFGFLKIIEYCPGSHFIIFKSSQYKYQTSFLTFAILFLNLICT